MKPFITIILLMFCVSLVAQQPYLRHFTDEDGLPSMVIYQVRQDAYGFLWIGTDNGLCRFDGQNFKLYENDVAKDAEYIGIYISPTKDIWCWNMSGQIFRIENDSLKLFKGNGLPSEFSTNKIVGDKSGNIWLANSNWRAKSFYYCDNQDSCFQKDRIATDIEIYNFLENKLEDYNYFIRKSTFFGYGGKNQSIREFFTQQIKDKEFSIMKTFFFHKKGNELFFFNQGNFIGSVSKKESVITIKKHPFTENVRKLYSNDIKGIYVDKFQNWWINDNEKLYAFSSKFETLNNGRPIIQNLDINNLLFDNENGYWFGTNGKGLYYMPNFKVLNFNKDNSPLKDNSVMSILESENDEILIFSKDGYVYTLNNNQISIKKKLKGPIELATYNKNFEHYYTLDNALFNILDNNLQNVNTRPITIGSVKDLIEEEKQFVVGNQENLITFPKDKLGLISSQTSNYELAERTYAIERTFDGKLWIGTINGLYVQDKNGVRPYKLSDKVDFSIWVNDIEQGRDSTIWITTKNEGVFLLKNDNVKQLLDYDGLASNSCEKIYFDDENDVWITSDEGLTLIDFPKETIKILDQSNGLPSNIVNSIYVKKGKVWVGTTQGISIFQKDDMLPPSSTRPIKIIKVSINGEQVPVKNSYQLSFGKSNFQFDFFSPSFKQKQVTYKYMMIGVDNNWKETNSNTVLYNNLSPGRYEFKVAAFSKNDDKSNQEETITIEIVAPYWQAWWFLLIVGLLVLSAILGIFYLFLSLYKSRKDKQIFVDRKMSELRINALQSQMNPHFIFNALNAIQNFFTTNERELAMIYLSKFAKLIRLIFEYSKLQVIPLNKEMEFLKLYMQLEELRFSDKVEFDLQTVDVIDKEDIMVPPLLIQPIIENSLKHGLLHKEKDGKLLVKFKQLNDKSIYCVVEDNGVGREKAKEFTRWRPKEYKSSGIKTIRERVSLINQEYNKEVVQFTIIDLVDNDGNAAGTRTEFWIKLDY